MKKWLSDFYLLCIGVVSFIVEVLEILLPFFIRVAVCFLVMMAIHLLFA